MKISFIDSILVESYNRKVYMDNVQSHKYLGQHISSFKNNFIHIETIKKSSAKIKHRITTTMNSLQLGKYYFECGVILLNSLLRRSILYYAKKFHNIKENEFRELENIEEDLLRNLIGSQKTCPISQLYLEFGHYPARFEIFKMLILFYQYIMKQDKKMILCPEIGFYVYKKV